MRLAAEATVDDRGSCGKRNTAPRGLWHASAPRSGQGWADVFGRRQDGGLLQLQGLREPLGFTRYDTDSCGAYPRQSEAEPPHPGERTRQQIARNTRTLRTRMKRLTRMTIYFFQSIQMHDIVIGLFVNRYEVGLTL